MNQNDMKFNELLDQSDCLVQMLFFLSDISVTKIQTKHLPVL
jgi:hypothetical protein